MKDRPLVVEVAMEIAYPSEFLNRISQKYGAQTARACAMSNSVGGIGPLLKERIPAQAELGLDVVGVSLLYDSVWIQGVHQWGQIFIEKKKVGHYLRPFLEESGIQFGLEMPDGSRCEVKARKAASGKAAVYYLDCPEVASVVYPGPEDAPRGVPNPQEWVEKQKLNQSWLVGRGALALLKALGKEPDVIVQSETPTFFANHLLVQDEFQKEPFFEKTKYVFNDHTPLEYAHPFWGEAQLKKARIDPRYAEDKSCWNRERNGIDVTRLLISAAARSYGVAKKHERVMKGMASLKDLSDKIGSITNGVSVAEWRHPDYRDAAALPDEALLALKEKKKAELIEWVWKRYNLWVNWRAKALGKCLVLWTRRITSYKRFDVLERLLKQPELRKRFLKTEIVALIGGRIHQNDDLSQNVIFNLLDLVTRDPELKDRVVVLDNYNIFDAPRLFAGVDASVMLADDGREASATGFMKAQLNGAAILASSDGAIPESVFFSGPGMNGFEVPYVHGQPEPGGLLSAMEALDKVYKDARGRAALVRASLAAEAQVSVERTAREMVELYKTLS